MLDPSDGQPFDELQLTTNFGKREIIRLPNNEPGHGGDERLPDAVEEARMLAGERNQLAARRRIRRNAGNTVRSVRPRLGIRL